MKIYLLVNETGNYSSYNKENVAAYLNKGIANAEADKRNVERALVTKARNEVWNYIINKWASTNPAPTIDEEKFSVKKYNFILNNKNNRTRTKDDKDYVIQYKKAIEKFGQEVHKYKAKQKEAHDNYIRSLTYLSPELVEGICEDTFSSYGEYSVEEIEIVDADLNSLLG